MARIYTNENFPRRVVQRLRELGHDVLTVFEAGNTNAGISDTDVLSFAIANQRIVLTLNRRDFIQLHILYQKQNLEHFGIIVCTQDTNTVRQAEAIHLIIMSTDTLDNQLFRVTRPR